jgi:hypothetical protein
LYRLVIGDKYHNWLSNGTNREFHLHIPVASHITDEDQGQVLLDDDLRKN